MAPIFQFSPPLIAHRGANNSAPENTLAAFLKAYELGAKWIEFDVMLSADGEAVVIHDETLARTTNGKGNVGDVSFDYLLSLDAGTWFNPRFAGERIPSFRAVMEFLKKYPMAANVEIKAVPGQEETVVTKVLSEIQRYWTGETPPLISSFSLPILRHIKEQAPSAYVSMLIDDWFIGWQEIAAELDCFSVNINQRIATPETVQTLKDFGKVVLAYTVNQPARALELFEMGVDAVFTDKFGEMVEALY